MGAHVTASGARFAVWAPNARRVSVVGDWNDWTPGEHDLVPQGRSGYWAGDVAGVVAGQRYKFAVEGADGAMRLKADPVARQAELRPTTPASSSRRPRTPWADEAWMTERDGRSSSHRPLRVYEVHLGSWQPGLGYVEAADRLADHVEHLGFTHVELLPVAEHPSAARGDTR